MRIVFISNASPAAARVEDRLQLEPQAPPRPGSGREVEPGVFRGSGQPANTDNPSWADSALDWWLSGAGAEDRRVPFVLASLAMITFEDLSRGTLVEEWKRLFNTPGARAAAFRQARESLLEQRGYQAVVALTGGEDDAISGLARLALGWARGQIPTDADPFTGGARHARTVDGLDFKRREGSRTQAVLDAASLPEMIDMVLEAAQGRTLTDLVIGTHGSASTIYFFGAQGQRIPVDLTRPEHRRELERLKPILKPGSQIYFAGCSVASSEENRQALQQLADRLGVRIFANRENAPFHEPMVGRTVAFYPRLR